MPYLDAGILLTLGLFLVSKFLEYRADQKRRTWDLCRRAITAVMQYGYSERKPRVQEVCVTLAGVLLFSKKDSFKQDMRTLIDRVLKQGAMSHEDIKKSLTLLASESQHKIDQADLLGQMLKSPDFAPETAAFRLADFLRAKTTHANEETAKKFLIILQACAESAGRRIPKAEIEELWKRESKIDGLNYFDDGFAPVTKNLNASSPSDTQKDLKRILQCDSDSFWIKAEHSAVVADILARVNPQVADVQSPGSGAPLVATSGA